MVNSLTEKSLSAFACQRGCAVRFTMGFCKCVLCGRLTTRLPVARMKKVLRFWCHTTPVRSVGSILFCSTCMLRLSQWHSFLLGHAQKCAFGFPQLSPLNAYASCVDAQFACHSQVVTQGTRAVNVRIWRCIDRLCLHLHLSFGWLGLG
jgi:hypothetical protein